MNDYLQTSDPSIYALGDAVEIRDPILNRSVLHPLAGPANKQGRIVANNISGWRERYSYSVGTAIVQVFGLHVGGWPEPIGGPSRKRTSTSPRWSSIPCPMQATTRVPNPCPSKYISPGAAES